MIRGRFPVLSSGFSVVVDRSREWIGRRNLAEVVTKLLDNPRDRGLR